MRNLINRRFGTLSQGQRKRASLARLLASSGGANATARAWLLDEPFVALDVDTQAQLAAVARRRLAAGGLVIYTSHQAVDIAAARVPGAGAMSLRLAAGAVFRRELQLFARRKSDWANPLMFFLIVLTVSVCGGSESERLKLIGIGVIFVGALLAAMLSLPRLFDEDAAMARWNCLTSPEPLAVLILARHRAFIAGSGAGAGVTGVCTVLPRRR